mmetsp:Transcript_17153/g.28683  ORF Transcript_17153/g.28683 Transcript_17153/m.28683 type:complete len:368 (+) Transcript_17153:181-1284(+)|eukprot:CAMPEP_0114414386 /NCGR_PEP_ID=MMETSP0103-20121206/1360_1 /TAXON_ID=37642 ORGANISM="Paraphysomonas imperforata, Strain PA2" /NCGR_SAMPLE_ID=MMETSP0103 /ASSEMBLY_ACC=CAM_ASM_000201 /LENGTH=367 /DNA_ID=CAMNT_0001582523 /DNA_START=101 /DNA_END=1204 /DNA_ORIENTATION=+
MSQTDLIENSKRAVIIGINGQMGTYLKDLLLKKGYQVHGIIRYSSTNRQCAICPTPREKLLQIEDGVVYHFGDLAEGGTLISIISTVRPHEVYNLGSVSNAQISFDLAEYVLRADGIGALRILEAVRLCSLTTFTRIYQAGSSELFGAVQESPQCETTAFRPRSPYGVSKLYAYWTVVNYREAYGMHASNGILYNSESPRRGKDFVTRKITSSVARIKKGIQEYLEIGNLDARRDWSHVQDFASAIWLMLQQDKGDDYVLSSGIARSVRDFISEAFNVVGIVVKWTGLPGSVLEQGVDCADSTRVLVRVNPAFFRPLEQFELRGNSAKAKTLLQWQPRTSFRALVQEMVHADLAALDCEHHPDESGS